MGKIKERFNQRIEHPGGWHTDSIENPWIEIFPDKPQGMMTKAEREQYAKFKEEEHPRDADGKFGEGGGGGDRDKVLDALEGFGFDRRDFDDPEEHTLESMQELVDYETEQAEEEQWAEAVEKDREEEEQQQWTKTESQVSGVSDKAWSVAEKAGWIAPTGIYRSKSSQSRYIDLERSAGDKTEYLTIRISDHAAPMGAGFNPESQEYNDPPDVDIVLNDDGTADLSNLQERVGGQKKKPTATSTPEFKNWFGDSKVVDEQGEPLVMYHGTNSDFETFERMGDTDDGYYGRGFYFTPSPQEAAEYGSITMPVYIQMENPLVLPTHSDSRHPSIFKAREILASLPGLPKSLKPNRDIPDGYEIKTRELRDFDYGYRPGENNTRFRVVPKPELYDTNYNVGRDEMTAEAAVIYFNDDPDGSHMPRWDAWTLMGLTKDVGRDAIKKAAIKAGHDGFIIEDARDGSTDEIVAFSPTQIKSSTGNQGSFDPEDPRINYSKQMGLWDEGEHPRDADGKFGEGGGSTATQEKPRATRKKTRKPPTKTEMRKREVKYNRANRLSEKRDYLLGRATRDMRSRTAEKADAAAVMRLILETGMRPGYNRPKEQPSFGASTLQARHIDANGETTLKFVGKAQVEHEIKISDKPLAEFLKKRAAQVRKTGGEDAPLFNVRESQLLKYAKNISGGKTFKVKDYRTMHGTAAARNLMSGMPTPTSKKDYKEAVKRVGDHVASILGNTRSVALQSYIDHRIFAEWKNAAGY